MPKLMIRDAVIIAAIDARRDELRRQHPGLRISREAVARDILLAALRGKRPRRARPATT